MRMDQGNTMRPKPALYDAAFLSYAFHYVYQSVEGITRKKIYILESQHPLKRCVWIRGT